uniref:BED-type domain-containing protein n=1 Tax=Anopheles funestus TaxID=62324 RepID=A0A1Y9HDK7_ANOFN
MPKLRLPKEEPVDSKPVEGIRVKQKRKNAHQVRKYFQSDGEKKQKCSFCGWETRENATRMVQHIVQRCTDASPEARKEISASVVDAEERQLQSFYTSHNKKVVHDFFKSVDNDRKRQCVFCRWTTILNLTRMRYHILEMCHYVPLEIRQSFMKQENTDDSQYDTYCIVNVDDGDRKGLQVVSSSSLQQHTDSEVVEEVVINTVDYIDQEETDTYYEDEQMEQISEDQPDDMQTTKPASEDEMELEMEDDENLSEEELEHEDKKAEIQFVNFAEGYYTVSKSCNIPERSKPVMIVKSPKDQGIESRADQTVKPFSKPTPPLVRVLTQKNQPRLSAQLSKVRLCSNVANPPKQAIVVKKEATMQPIRKSDQTAPIAETRQEKAALRPQISPNIGKTSQQTKHRVATSTSLHNTPRQVRAFSFIKQNVDYFSEYKIDTSG